MSVAVDESLLNLKAVPYKRGEELTQLRDEIARRALELRDRKAATSGTTVAEKAAVFGIISDLLELKFLDEENEDCVPPKGFKLRWRVLLPDGQERVLQRPVQFRTSLSAHEVLHIVQTHTRNHFAKLNGAVVGDVLKIERVIKLETPASGADGKAKAATKSTKTYHAMDVNDRIVLPLKFPGPVLEECAKVELRVTFAEPPRHFAQPSSFVALPTLPSLIDAGVNLYTDPLSPDIHAHVRRAFAAGVEQSVLISVDAASAKCSLELARLYENSLFVAVGVHPGMASAYPPTDENIAEMRALLTQPGVCAVGEVGLDYSLVEGGSRFRALHAEQAADESKNNDDDDDDSKAPADGKEKKAAKKPAPLPQAAEKRVPPTRADQSKWFEVQLQLAAELKLPMLLHEREAHDDFVRIVKERRASLLADGVAINCFSGDAAQLKTYTQDLNAYVCITGLLCNLDRSQTLADALKAAPSLDRVLVGSDAPYLTPFTMGAPFPKFNVPETLPHVAARLAEVTSLDVAQLCAAAVRNARTAFRLPTLVRSSTALANGVGSVTLALNRVPKPVVEKAAVAAPAKKTSVLPEGVSESDVYLYERKYYRVNDKERSILTKQQAALDKAQFEKLLSDFALEVVAEQPERKPKKSGAAGGKRGGRGGKRGGARGRGGRGGARGGRGAAAAAPAAGRGSGRGGRGGRGGRA